MIEASNDAIPINRVDTLTQTTLDSNIHYTHSQPESILSRLAKVAAMVMRQKTLVERDITKGQFDQNPASIPNSLTAKFQIKTSEVNGRPVWRISPMQHASDRVVLFVHGGAHIYNITTQHWQFIEQVIMHTNATFIVPDYPLAPGAHSDDVFDFMTVVYEQVLTTTSPRNITFMGDSAGAGLAFGFTQSLRNDNRPLPKRLILLSPFLDITMSHPDIPTIERQDKVLAAKGLRLAGAAYAGDLDHNDYQVSPIYGDLSDLPEISVFIGTHDLFIADARRLKARMQAEALPLNYFEYPKMMHDWMLVVSMPESRHVIEQISDQI